MYLMLGTRLDISFATNYFSRFQDRNSNELWTHLKRLLRYLKGTKEVGLWYVRSADALPLVYYVDTDWAQDMRDRQSISGYLMQVYGNTVLWVTRKQNYVALSSTEAELVALCAVVQDGLWYKKLLQDLIKNFKTLEDNQSCIALIRNPENNKRVKRIDLKYKFVCESLKKREIVIEYINTRFQLADTLTKGLNREKILFKFQKYGFNRKRE